MLDVTALSVLVVSGPVVGVTLACWQRGSDAARRFGVVLAIAGGGTFSDLAIEGVAGAETCWSASFSASAAMPCE